MIIYDDTQDLGAKNGFHFHKQHLQYLHLHLHGGKSMAFMRFALIIIWRVLIGGVLRKSLLVDPCLQGLFENLKCLGVCLHMGSNHHHSICIYTYSKTACKQFLEATLLLLLLEGN